MKNSIEEVLIRETMMKLNEPESREAQAYRKGGSVIDDILMLGFNKR